jgi:hypothetical protein
MNMPTLAETQNSLVATIKDGPNALNPALYSGPIERVLLAMQSHANTNSFARLTALEDSFPLTRDYYDAHNFHQLCRSYCATASARADDLNALGETLVAYMESQNVAADTIELAQVEWAWLHSYHAPDAVALSMPEIAKMNSAELLSFGIGLHPAVYIVPITAPLAPPLREQIEVSENTVALAVLRPANEVRILALDALSNQLMSITAQKNAVIGNLLSCVLEYSENDATLAPILRLISAGALIGIKLA